MLGFEVGVFWKVVLGSWCYHMGINSGALVDEPLEHPRCPVPGEMVLCAHSLGSPHCSTKKTAGKMDCSKESHRVIEVERYGWGSSSPTPC